MQSNVVVKESTKWFIVWSTDTGKKYSRVNLLLSLVTSKTCVTMNNKLCWTLYQFILISELCEIFKKLISL
ncbi:hypothetical protein QQG55_5775 [Brugia pahangi]